MRSHSQTFFEKSRKGKLRQLIDEFNSINPNNTSITISEDLADKFKEASTIVNTWREHYKIPSTDPRFLNATLSDIYDDYLLFRLIEMREFFSERVVNKATINFTMTQDEFDKLNEQDVSAIRTNIDNYCDDEDLIEAEEEKKLLLEKMKLMRSNVDSETKIRLVQIKARESQLRKNKGQ